MRGEAVVAARTSPRVTRPAAAGRFRFADRRNPRSVRRGFPRLLVLVTLAAVIATVVVGSQRGADSAPQVLWGIGDQLPAATQSQLYRSGTADLVTAWYNGPEDLSWITGYSKPSTLSALYGSGTSVELVVWLGDHPDYAVSAQFQSDISELVTSFKGSGPHYGPLYVVLFSEWETYSSDPAYRAQLKSAYLSATERVHAAYSQAKVALGFGGYEWGSEPTRDLSFWQDAIAASDFTAVQAMQACDSTRNGQSILVPQIRSSVQQLGSYGKPVMISHFKMWGDTNCQVSAFKRFAAEMFTDRSMRSLWRDHLFAWSFMQDAYLTTSFARARRSGSASSATRAHPRPDPIQRPTTAVS